MATMPITEQDKTHHQMVRKYKAIVAKRKNTVDASERELVNARSHHNRVRADASRIARQEENALILEAERAGMSMEQISEALFMPLSTTYARRTEALREEQSNAEATQ